jgi:putative ABC transport system substrate-binding protein
MRRREFVAALGGAAAWPLAARAQQGRMRRIGVLTALDASDPQVKAWLTAFEDGLQKLGWRQGRNLSIDYRWPGSDERRLQTSAAELVRTAPDALFAAATPALVALQRETRSLPIVFAQVSDPVKLGFVASLARPGGNITGFTTFEYSIGGKWLELLKDTAPATSRVAVIFDPDNPSQPQYVQGIEAGAPSFGVQLTLAAARNAAEVERAIDAFAQQTNAALVVVPNTVTIQSRWRPGIGCRLFIRIVSSPAAGALCRTELIWPTRIGERRRTSILFSRVPSRPICLSSCLPNSNSSSTSKRRRRWV